ncbi:MAG: terminase TerL endonuclease subunit [Actinomycetota bacterium]
MQYPYQDDPRYDKEVADHAVDFISCLTHTKGQWAGKPFRLLDWQEHCVIRPLFGILKSDGFRQYRKVYIEIPKKQGKTELGSAIALYLLAGDGEEGAEVYSAAADREQASLVFRPAAKMVRNSRYLSKQLKVLDSQRRIVYYGADSYYQVLSSDVRTKHGFNVHGCVFDELHAQPNRDLYDVLSDGAGDARRQPVMVYLTTAGYDKNSVCWEVHDYAIKVRDGIIDDSEFLPVIFSAGEQDDWSTIDWTDEEIWKKANPSLGRTFDIERLRVACEEAKQVPSKENIFKRLRLNIWTSQETKWLPMKLWDEAAGEIDLDKLKGRTCYGGLDLASSIDIAAFVLDFPLDENKHAWLPFFWIPADNIADRVKKDKVPYDQWVKRGFIKATPGNVINYDTIEADIAKIGELYKIKEIPFDRWGATQISQHLDDAGFTMVPMGQGFASMASPTKEVETMVMQKRLIHGGHPVLRWMASNVAIKQDPAGNMKPDKSRSRERIDGIVAGIMAVDRALRHKNKKSVYDTRGVRSIG